MGVPEVDLDAKEQVDNVHASPSVSHTGSDLERGHVSPSKQQLKGRHLQMSTFYSPGRTGLRLANNADD